MSPEGVTVGPQARAPESGTRACLYAAMTQLIYDRGYHAASLRQLAGSVGLQIASIYHYFASKQDLLLEIMTQTMSDLTESVATAVAAAGDDPVQRLSAGIGAHIAFHTERRCEAYVADSELRSLTPENRARITEMRDTYEGMFISLLEQGCRGGAFTVDDVPLAVKALMAMCTEVSVWYRPDGRLTLPAITDSYTGLLLNGIRNAQPAGPPPRSPLRPGTQPQVQVS
jgi:AcrR family transcriptional regulator